MALHECMLLLLGFVAVSTVSALFNRECLKMCPFNHNPLCVSDENGTIHDVYNQCEFRKLKCKSPGAVFTITKHNTCGSSDVPYYVPSY